MKYIATLLLLGMSAVAFAQTAEQAQQRNAHGSLYEASIRDSVRDITIANVQGTAINGENAQHISNATSLMQAANIVLAESAAQKVDGEAQKADAAKQNADAANELAYAAQVNGQINSRNAACPAVVSTQAQVDWCRNEAARLTPFADRVNEWNGKVTVWAGKVNTWRDEVNTAQAKVKSDWNLFLGAVKVYDAESARERAIELQYLNSYKNSLEHIKAFREKLGVLQNEFDECKQALGNAKTLEELHETCGSMFDGNIVQTVSTRYPVPNRTFIAWNGPKICATDGVTCVMPDPLPMDLFNN